MISPNRLKDIIKNSNEFVKILYCNYSNYFDIVEECFNEIITLISLIRLIEQKIKTINLHILADSCFH